MGTPFQYSRESSYSARIADGQQSENTAPLAPSTEKPLGFHPKFVRSSAQRHLNEYPPSFPLPLHHRPSPAAT